MVTNLTHLKANIRKLLIATKFSWLLAFTLLYFAVVFGASMALAVDYTNTNFILRNPAITISGGRSTTSAFELYTATGQTGQGESTNASFTYQAGFLYFGEAEEEEESSGGGGGGGGIGPKVIFSGKAYPNSQVVLLQDSQIAENAFADNNADFTIEVGNLSPGDYIFSLYAKDYSGKASRLIVIPVQKVQNKNTTINNILIPPTISKDKKEVAKGDTITFFGQSLPNASVIIKVGTPSGTIRLFTATSGADGKYQYVVNTASLDYGAHTATAEASLGNIKSESSLLRFIVGDANIPEEAGVCPVRADLNNDCAVNLVDFSILIYWFDRPNVPADVDLDGNGKADLVDFSIMAYHWTG